MSIKVVGTAISLTLTISLVAADTPTPSAPRLSAAEIADRNVQARGGLQAWRAVQTMSLTGKMGVGGNQRATLPQPAPGRRSSQLALPQRPVDEIQLPFVMDLERPRKMRFELQFNGQTAIQVFDGVNGWKLRPYLNRMTVETYTADEMKVASGQADLDGPLVDYVAKGTRIELEGVDQVEGRETYRLKLTPKGAEPLHIWIDARTFLETKIDGKPRRLDGIEHPVEVYFRDYRTVNGLQIPYILETKVLPVTKTGSGLADTPVPPERITIERVVVNPRFDASLFSKPEITVASNAN